MCLKLNTIKEGSGNVIFQLFIHKSKILNIKRNMKIIFKQVKELNIYHMVS